MNNKKINYIILVLIVIIILIIGIIVIFLTNTKTTEKTTKEKTSIFEREITNNENYKEENNKLINISEKVKEEHKYESLVIKDLSIVKNKKESIIKFIIINKGSKEYKAPIIDLDILFKDGGSYSKSFIIHNNIKPNSHQNLEFKVEYNIVDAEDYNYSIRQNGDFDTNEVKP